MTDMTPLFFSRKMYLSVLSGGAKKSHLVSQSTSPKFQVVQGASDIWHFGILLWGNAGYLLSRARTLMGMMWNSRCALGFRVSFLPRVVTNVI